MTTLNELPDLSDKSVEDLLELKLELETDLDSIRAQIDAARSKAAATGVYADADWWRKVNWAKKLKGRMCQKLQLEIRKRRDPKDALGRAFLEVARRSLNPEVFEQLQDQALEFL